MVTSLSKEKPVEDCMQEDKTGAERPLGGSRRNPDGM